MEHEIVAVLKEIRLGLYCVVLGTFLAVILSSWRFWITIRGDYRKALGKVFDQIAEDHFEKGEFKELIEHCNEKLSQRPNHHYALWYLGRAHFSLKEYENARVPFEKLVQIEPGWDTSHVRPYLMKIDAQSRHDA
ncbi:MAG: hypothetical protein ABL907_09515 [Hyphomicrobium sp.]